MHHSMSGSHVMKPSHLVKLEDSHQCDVIGIGDISMHFSDGSHLNIKNAPHSLTNS